MSNDTKRGCAPHHVGAHPLRNIIINDRLLSNDWLILRNQRLHDEPANQISNGTDAEDNHIASRLSFKSHELEC